MAHSSLHTMPAEGEKQSRVWFAWPHQKSDWPGKFAPVPWVFCEMLRLITSHQRVGLIVRDAALRADAMQMLDRAGVTLKQIDFVEARSNRGWMRDCGAIFVRDAKGKKTALQFGFNGWAKYRNHTLDAALPPEMAQAAGVPCVKVQHEGRPVVLEGGGIEVNGAGKIIVTEEWLLSDIQVRNPGFARRDYEAVFARYLGASRTIWLKAGIVGDDTHGHVDDITRFVSENTVVTCVESNKHDANYTPLRENLKRLKKVGLEVIELPMPAPVTFEGERLPASYANFLITNNIVLVPVFNDAHDRIALNILQQCFRDRQVVGVYARDLVWGLGTIHCLSQQEM